MRKKALIILPIIVVVCIILVIPKHKDNVIENVPQETVEISSTPEISEAMEETTLPQENKTVAETTQQETDNNEVTTTTEETTVDDGINSTHTDIELGEDEYKGDNGNDALQNSYNNLTEDRQQEVDAALQRAKERHPDWFQDDSTGNTRGDIEHVGTPSTGELPTYTVGESGDSGVPAGTVY